MDLEKLKAQLIKHEDLKLKPYTDTVGKLTIGVGHNLSDLGLTLTQVLSILSDDISNTLKFLDKNCSWFKDLDEVRQRAIADLTFDLMGGVLAFHHMIDALKAQDWDRASAELLNSAFGKQTGQRAKDLAYMLKTGQDV